MAEDPIGQIVSHYRIVGKLGAGGMGEVYRAEDTKLGRTVALKFLPADLANDRIAVERLQREARAASALNHPNICTIHDIDAHEGRHFIVMEHLEGVSLRQRIDGRAMSLHEIVEVANQVASALDAAHKKGIVHRDIKPANIVVMPDGRAKVLDFGLAKIEPRRGLAQGNSAMPTVTGEENLTSPGSAVGTVVYMSPEQVRGEELDARTDLFSFGAVLYEMATGRQAFAGNTSGVIFHSILERDPSDLRQLNPALPAEFGRIVGKTLEKDRRLRYQSAAELRADLARLQRDSSSGRISASERAGAVAPPQPFRPSKGALGAAGLVIAGLLAGAAWLYLGGSRAGAIDSVVVLPFANASGDPNNEYLSDGITENLISRLSQIPNLRVISSTSAFRYKGKDVDPGVVARDLKVRAVVVGRLSKHGDTLTIDAELVDTRDDRQLWGGQYERKLSDILNLQDEIAGVISEKLRLRLSGEDKKRLIRHETENTEAYQRYLKGRYLWHSGTPEGLRSAIGQFQQAIDLDPTYAPAYVGLADGYLDLAVTYFQSPEETTLKAKAAAKKAIELDDSLGEAYSALGFSEWLWDIDRKSAEPHLKRGIELDPNSSMAHFRYGLFLVNLGRFKEGLAEHRRSIDLDPLSTYSSSFLAYNYMDASQYDEAIAEAQKAMAADTTNNPILQAVLAWAYAGAGKYPQALAVYEKVPKELLTITSDHQFVVIGQAWVYAVAGKKKEALAILDAYKKLSTKEYVDPYMFAAVYSALGDKEKALEWLEQARLKHSGGLCFVKIDVFFVPLHSDPRFQAILQRLDLAD